VICPVCKSSMIVIEYHNIELDYCSNCKGVWFDSGELELLLKSCNMEDIKLFLENITNSPATHSAEKKRKCPICNRKMQKKTIEEQSQILIDVCGKEHGLWFDGGEVVQLIKRLDVEHRLIKNSGGKVISFLEEVFKAP